MAHGGRRAPVRRRPPHAGKRAGVRSSRAFELRGASWRIEIDSPQWSSANFDGILVESARGAVPARKDAWQLGGEHVTVGSYVARVASSARGIGRGTWFGRRNVARREFGAPHLIFCSTARRPSVGRRRPRSLHSPAPSRRWTKGGWRSAVLARELQFVAIKPYSGSEDAWHIRRPLPSVFEPCCASS